MKKNRKFEPRYLGCYKGSYILAFSIDDVDLPKARGHCPVRHGRDLLRLAFPAIECAAEVILLLPSNSVTSVPKINGVSLVSHVTQHLADFPIFDFVENLAAKLKIVSLLINAPAPIANDVDPILHVGNQGIGNVSQPSA